MNDLDPKGLEAVRENLPSRIMRPIIGIENRTAQEVFDIMCDRFRHLSAVPDGEGKLVERVKELETELDRITNLHRLAVQRDGMTLATLERERETARLSQAMVWPDKPTPAMRDALRIGSRADVPSDELCNIRYAALKAALAASRLSQAGVRVKPLEWREGETRFNWYADRYHIHENRLSRPSLFIVKGWNAGTNPYETLEEAKAAAQADYDTRIRSALSGDTP